MSTDSMRRDMIALARYADENPLDDRIGTMPDVDVKVLPHYNGPLPDAAFLAPAQPGDAGIDLYASIRTAMILRPGERNLIPTGLCFAVPEGYEMQVRPKSGLASKLGMSIVNTPGTVDSGYRGEVQVIAVNLNPAVNDEVMDAVFDAIDGSIDSAQAHETYDLYRHGATITITPGMKIAQIVYARFERPIHNVVKELSSTARGTSGFGSTGA